MTQCRSCGAEILFIKNHRTGKFMPCDAEEVCSDDANEGEKLVTKDGKIITVGDISFIGYVPHWATCVHADHHRRKI